MSYDLVTITAGHNKHVTGASGNGYKEHEQARLLVTQVAKDFKAVGQKTAICTDEVGKTKTEVWSNAVKKCNSYPKAGRLDMAMHLNAFDGESTGVEVLFKTQKALAAEVSNDIANATGLKNRGAKLRNDIGFLNATHVPAILIEAAFIDNKNDMEIFKKKLPAISKAIVKAVTGKTVQEPKPAPKPTQKQASKELHRVQVGAFADRKNAENLVAKLKKDGYPATIV